MTFWSWAQSVVEVLPTLQHTLQGEDGNCNACHIIRMSSPDDAAKS